MAPFEISREQFARAAERFAARSAELGEGWTLRYVDGESLLVLRSVSDGDDVVLEHHVVHDCAFGAPLLLFIAHDRSGEAVKPALPSTSSAVLFSQRMHPLLQLPFWSVHPCRTASLMAELRPNRPEDFLAAWLSAVGQLVGVAVDPRHFTKEPS